MAPGTWLIYGKAKEYMMDGTIRIGTDVFKMQLHRASASAAILVVSTRSVSTSIGSEISARGVYAQWGRTLVPANMQVGAGVSAKQKKVYYSTTGLVFTASGSSLIDIKYALIRTSVSATGGKLLCFVTLSASQFTIASPNTLTILANASGVFTLA